jgi:hypothetical protein
MTQVIPASLIAPARSGLTVGYRLLTTALTQYAPFTTTGVSESAPGNYVVSSGVTAPASGGYIQWGLPDGQGSLGEVLAVGVILAAPALASDSRLSFLDRAISSRMPRSGWPP